MEGAAHEVADLASRVAVSAGDGGGGSGASSGGLRPAPEDMLRWLQQYLDDMLGVRPRAASGGALVLP